MQTLELDFLPLEAPKKQDPPKIHFTRFGHRVSLNKSFLMKTGLEDIFQQAEATLAVRLAVDKKKPLDWYLVVDSGKEAQGIKSWEHNAAGDLVLKNTHWVKQFLADFGEGKTSIQKLISTDPIQVSNSCKAFSIITKS